MERVATSSRKVLSFRGGEYVASLMAELSRAGIAQRIALARKQAGLNQHELADVLGVHWRTVQDWESPKKETTPWDRLDELAAVMGVTKDWLLHGEREGVVADVASLDRRLQELEARLGHAVDLMDEALRLLREAPQRDAQDEPVRRRAGSR